MTSSVLRDGFAVQLREFIQENPDWVASALFGRDHKEVEERHIYLSLSGRNTDCANVLKGTEELAAELAAELAFNKVHVEEMAKLDEEYGDKLNEHLFDLAISWFGAHAIENIGTDDEDLKDLVERYLKGDWAQ